MLSSTERNILFWGFFVCFFGGLGSSGSTTGQGGD